MADLEWSVADGIGTIRLNRPEQRNAFTFDMVAEWAELLRTARTDDDVRVVVLTGTGDKAFCSGVDLSSISNANPDLTPLERKSQLHDQIHRVALELEALDKPVIASINGVAVGAGLDMALMCDLRIASRSARMSEGYVKVGLTPGDGGAYYLPRLVGTSKALELLLTGDFVTADEAHRIGMVNRVVDPGGPRRGHHCAGRADRGFAAGDRADDQARHLSVGRHRPADRAGPDLVALRGRRGDRGRGRGARRHEGQAPPGLPRPVDRRPADQRRQQRPPAGRPTR